MKMNFFTFNEGKMKNDCANLRNQFIKNLLNTRG